MSHSPYRICYPERPLSVQYGNDYGYTRHIYQPITDYLNVRSRDIRARHPVFPSTSHYERYQRHYSPSNIDNMNFEEEEQRLLQIRAKAAHINHSLMNWNPSVPTYTAFRSPDALLLTPSSRPDCIAAKSIRKNVAQEGARRAQNREDFARMLRIQQKYAIDEEPIISDTLKRSIRGRSPDSIADALLAEAEENIQKGRRQDRMFQHMSPTPLEKFRNRHRVEVDDSDSDSE